MGRQTDLFNAFVKPPSRQNELFNIKFMRPADTRGIRDAIFKRLEPIAQEIKKEKLSSFAVAEGFYKMANEFRKEGERQLTGGE